MWYNMVMDINPLETNVIFNVGQVLMLILSAFTIVSAIFKGIFKLTDQVKPETLAEKWLERFLLALLYTGLLWLGLSALTSYFGESLIDIINGAVILIMMAVSIVQRATSEQRNANRTLVFAYAWIAVVILWHFIFGSVVHNFSPEFVRSVGEHVMPNFPTDVLKLWGWA